MVSKKKEAEESVEDVEETGVSPNSEEPETLNDFTPKPRGYMDRMMKPQRGMDLRPWKGKPHWICPRCKLSTFNEREAKAHRC